MTKALFKHYKPHHFEDELDDLNINCNCEWWYDDLGNGELRIDLSRMSNDDKEKLADYLYIDEDLNEYDYLILF